MGQSSQKRLSNSHLELFESRICRNIETQGKWINEIARYRFELGSPAPGGKAAENDIVLVGVAMEQCDQSSKKRHVERDSCLLAGISYFGNQVFRKRKT